MSIAESIARFPEEWHPAAEADNFSPQHYDLQWNHDWTLFRPIEVSWNDTESYIRYQSC